MKGLGLLPTPHQLETVRAMSPRHYGGGPASMLPFESALAFTRYVTMWLLWDDEVAESPTRMEALELDFAAMAGLPLPEEARTPYREAWVQTGDAIERLGGSSALRKRWVLSMREFARHALLAGELCRGPSPDVRSSAEALRLRTFTIGLIPTLIYEEACCGVELPDALARSDDYREFCLRASIVMGIQNDLASLAKDFQQGSLNTNLVLRHWSRTGCSLQEAYGALIDIHDKAIDTFDALAERLLSRVAPPLRERVATYFDTVRFVETGFGFFHVHAHRYARWTAMEGGCAHRFELTRR